MAFIPYYACLLAFLPAILPNAGASGDGNFGSYSGRRYAAYEYDLTTPQYTPDGRLLQVEYATNACTRAGSNPIASVGIGVPGSGDTVLVMATISSPRPSATSSPFAERADGRAEPADEDETDPFATEKNQRTQFRIIEVPLSASYSSDRRVSTSKVLVGMSGLLSDATSLLTHAHCVLEDEQRAFGWHRLGLSPVGISALDDSDDTYGGARRSGAPSRRRRSQPIAAQPSETTLRLSRAIADECQKHAFGGGLRPYGASLLLAGIDGDSESCREQGARVAMCETRPDGGRRSLVSTMKGDHGRPGGRGIAAPQIMVSGGSLRSQSKLISSMESGLRQLYQEQSGTAENSGTREEGQLGEIPFLHRALRTVVSCLVEEWSDGGDPLRLSSTASSGSTRDALESGQQHDETKYDEGNSGPHLPQMEVVIASSKQGTFRLSDADAAQLMKQTNNRE